MGTESGNRYNNSEMSAIMSFHQIASESLTVQGSVICLCIYRSQIIELDFVLGNKKSWLRFCKALQKAV